jgi:hypothetical protein
VVNKTCLEEGCEKQPSFGLEQNDQALWCSAHSPPGSVSLNRLRCVEPECSGPRSFGSMEDGRGMRCRAHKQEGDASRQELRAKAQLAQRGRE